MALVTAFHFTSEASAAPAFHGPVELVESVLEVLLGVSSLVGKVKRVLAQKDNLNTGFVEGTSRRSLGSWLGDRQVEASRLGNRDGRVRRDTRS